MLHSPLKQHFVRLWRRFRLRGGSARPAVNSDEPVASIDLDSEDEAPASTALTVPIVYWRQLVPDDSKPIEDVLRKFPKRPSPTPSTNTSASFSPEHPTHLIDSDLPIPPDIIKLIRTSPLPSNAALAGLRSGLAGASAAGHNSIGLSHRSEAGFFPLWIEKCLTQLATTDRQVGRWQATKRWLGRQAATTLSEQCLARLHLMSWHAPIPGLKSSLLSTSDLPTLLSDDWLTDDHMNAAGDWINTKLGFASHIRVVHIHFLAELARSRSHFPLWSPSRPRELDSLILSAHVTCLLFPVFLLRHWTFLIIYIQDQSCIYVDSLDPYGLFAPPGALELVDWWLGSVLGVPFELSEDEVIPFDVGTQTDSHECGVAVLGTMAHVALGEGSWTQERSEEHRMMWCLRLTGAWSLSTSHSWSSDFPSPPLPPGAGYESGMVFDVDPLEVVEFDFEPIIFEHSRSSKRRTVSPPLLATFISASAPSTLTSPSAPIPHHAPLPHPPPSTSATPPSSQPMAPPLPRNRPPPTLTQSVLGFSTITRKDWLLQEAERVKRTDEERAESRSRAELEKLRMLAERREKDRKRKASFREGLKEEQIKIGLRNADGTVIVRKRLRLTDDGLAAPGASTAELSRPRRNFKELHRQQRGPSGRKRKHLAKPAQRVNWMSPFLWSQILDATRRIGYPWSPTQITRHLQTRDPVNFADLRPQRISDWRDNSVTDRLVWRPYVLKAVAKGNKPLGVTTRRHIFAPYPELEAKIKQQLLALRKSGLPLDVTTVRAFIVALVSVEAPELFKKRDRRGRVFRASEPFIRRYLKRVLRWSLRRGTRAAQKVPQDAQNLLLRALLRMACLKRDEGIDACFVVNADQTQVVYAHGSNTTWSETGAKQVEIVGKEEKRAFTLMVGIAQSGTALPFQAIYTGKDPRRSLPKPTASRYAEAMELGFRFVVSGTATYWSTQETMRDYVTHIVVPYFEGEKTRLKRPRQRCIFQIDVWSVHRSVEFRSWIGTAYPWITVHYVPAGCTGLFQPCDVGPQRPTKAAIKAACLADIVNETLAAIKSGVEPGKIILDKRVGIMRDRSVGWLLAGWTAINRPGLILQAFEKCEAGPFNLSHASLTSREALDALIDLRSTDPEFYEEISSGRAEAIDTAKVFEEDHAPSVEELQTTADDEVDSDDDDASTDMEESEEEEEFDADTPMEAASGPLPAAAQPVSSRPTRSTTRPTRFEDEHTGPDWWEREDAE